ncbi:hypothetical protein GGU11DRAFT_743029 [Lentinula aff. detonsa]|nr:hypothetical protein GGU11DRAFT_743029 [Lentinula aff. detonsa]
MSAKQPHLVIVGAEVESAFERQLGFTDFTTVNYVRRGTSYKHIYIQDAHLTFHVISILSAVTSTLTGHFATQPKILAYWQSLYKKHDLERHAKFQTSVHEAEWDEERQVWRVTLRKEKTGKYMEELIDACFMNGLG